MAEAMRIRATLQGDVAEVRVAIVHPMETGLRKNEKGDVVPAHFINQVTATHNGRTVLDAQLSQGISRDPFIAFKVRGAKAGDKLTVSWVDNKGDKGGVETTVGNS
jgi:sulfur-oxidizing protein SoxZ